MPVGFRIASAWVDIRAEDKGLRKQVSDAIEKAVRGQGGEVKLKINTKGLRKEVQTALNEATKGQKPLVSIGIKSTGLRKEVTDALARATAKQKPTVKLGISSTGLRGEVQRALTAATSGQRGTVTINARVDADSITRAIAGADPTIRPDVDLTYTRAKLRAAISGLRQITDFTITPDLDTAMMRMKIKAEVAALRDKFKVQITPDLNVSTFEGKLRAAAAALSHNDIEIDFNPRVNALKARAELMAKMKGLKIHTDVKIDPDFQSLVLATQVQRATAALNRMPHDLVFRTRVDADISQARAAMNRIEKLGGEHAGRMSRLTKLVAASVLLVPPALAIVDNAVRHLGPSLAVVVPMFAALATMGATVMVGMNGVGEAVKQSGQSAKRYAEALDRLTPAARAFVEAIVEQKSAFADLQDQVQETLFHGMATDLRQMAKVTIPDFTIGLGGMALILNGMAKGVMNTTTQLSKMGLLKTMFGGMQLAMKPLVPIPGQILAGLVRMSIAAMPLFIRMNTAMGKWFDDMTAKLNKAFDNGTLQAAISRSGQDIVNFFKRIANNPEFEQFMSHMKATGPEMSRLFTNIAEALLKLVNNLSPIAGAVIKVANAFAKMVVALPDEFIKTILSIWAAFRLWGMLSGIVLGLTGAIVKMNVALRALGGYTAMVTAIGPAMARVGATAPAIRRTAVAVGILARAGLALGALWLIFKGIDMAMTKLFNTQPPNVDKLTDSLLKFNKTGELSGEAARVFKVSWADGVDGMDKKFGGLQAAIKGIAHAGTWDHIFNGFQKAFNWIDPGKTDLEKFQQRIGAVDKALEKMVKGGHTNEANKLFATLSKEAHKAGTSTDKFQSLLPKYTKALKDAKDAQKAAAETMGIFGESAIRVSGRLKDLKADTDGLTKSMFEMNNVNRESESAMRDFEKNIDDLAAAAKKGSVNLSYQNGVLSQNNDKQRDAAVLLENVASSSEKAALATYSATGSWEQAAKTLNDGKAAIVANSDKLGLSTEEAKKYADAILKIPSKKEINIMVAGQAEKQLASVAAAYRATPDKKTVNVGVLSTAAIQVLTDLGYKVESLPDGTFTVTAKAKQAEDDLEYLENYKISPKTVAILAKITAATIEIDKAQNKVNGLKQKQAVAVGASKKKLDKEVAAAQKVLDDLKQKRKVDIAALDKTGPGVKAAQDHLDGVKDKKVTITIATILGDSGKTAADAIRAQAEAQARAAKKKKAFGGAIRRASGGGVGGGFVSGAGGPTADKIQALLSNGEYVVRASSVKKYGSSMMGAINNGNYPKFAVGGPVTGGGATAGPGGAGGTTTGTFTVTDATGKPVASALNNFKSLQDGAKKTYASINADTTGFSKTLTSGVQGAGTKSVGTWNTWASGMKSKTDAGYKGVRTLTDGFSRNQLAKTNATKTGTHSVWNSWKTGMESRTKATYGTINAATSTFSKQSVSKMGNARDGMGSAWGGLSPKFKPPVSYLVHSVINKGLVGSMNAIMSKLGGGKAIGGISVPGFATGGPIYGAGSKTSDSIPARLSNGEFVMQAKAVDKFGTGFMSSLNSGTMPHDGAGFKPGFKLGGSITIPGFASGGQVGIPSSDTLNKIMGEGGAADVKKMTDFIMNSYVLPLIDSGGGGSAMKAVQRAGMTHIRSNVEAFVKDNFGGAGSAAAGLRWAKTQYGKPYQWGGNGNPSWDCSGFMSAIESVIRGESPHRRWATGSFGGGSAAPGWKLGAKAPFQIGVTNAGVGHTAGTIGKENVESSGGVGVHGGVGVSRGAHDGMFDGVYGYVGPNATKKASGGYISGPGGPTSDKVAAWLSNGEYVIRSAAVKKLGTGYLNSLNSGRTPGFATGGSVGQTYKIQSGDTLSGIAAKFHTTVKALMALNKTITNANKIYAGKTITISSGSSTGGGTTTPTTPPGFSLAAVGKAGKTGIQSTDGINDLKGFVTLSQASIEANKAGANIKDELINALKGQDSFATLTQNFYDLQAKIKAAFKGTAETTMLNRFNTVVQALTPLQKSLDGVNGKLETASTDLEEVKGKFDGLKDSVSTAILDFGNITKVGKWGTNPQVLLDQLQTDVTKANAFGAQLKQLKDKGISADLIGKIAEAGITGGGAATAASLLNMTPAQVAQLNALQGQLTTAANNAGTAAASGMYGAGVNAAQGLVDGLKSQQKAIQDQMLLIAAAMEKAIKQALGIKSPSKVMSRVGHFTADGLIQAVASRKAEANAAIRALVPAQGVAGMAPRMGSSLSSTGTMGSGSAVTNIGTINVNVDGSFDLTKTADRRAIAKALVVEIKEEIRRDDKKRR